MFLIHLRNNQDLLQLNYEKGSACSQKAKKGPVKPPVYKTSEGAGIKMFHQAVSRAVGDASLLGQTQWKLFKPILSLPKFPA